jgi:hypothetical protein
VAGSSNRNFEHGNPGLELPTNHDEGRLIVCGEDQQPIWISHELPRFVDYVRVNVAEGHFTAKARGWSVLAAGRYGYSWNPKEGTSRFLGFIQILPHRIFDAQPENTPDDEPGWLTSPLESGDRLRFREGAMHGVLRAEFHAQENTDDISWGLIVRHYNAFHHLRVVCQLTSDACSVKLLRLANTPPDLLSQTVLAETSRPKQELFPMHLEWSFNGTSHQVSINGKQLLQAFDDYMGGVEIVGVIDRPGNVTCGRVTLDSTQTVKRHVVERPSYRAEIRPGNIDRLFLKHSEQPSQNIAWESGIQFGHIGGSEIKFSQCAELRLVDDGPVATTVEWNGPCPKFVDQASDIRGWADGRATFFRDHIVIADNVLTWTNRSVGPDIDLLGRLLEGPARLALAGEECFSDWPLRAFGEMTFVDIARGRACYPAALAIPLRLGAELWWLKVLVFLRSPNPNSTPAGVFAWQCPHGLTASHDFRCTPTSPGQEYAFTIAVAWQKSELRDPVEHALLRWRNQWIHPMQILLGDGKSPVGTSTQDSPRDTMNLNGCFDRSRGLYVIPSGRVEWLRLDPLQIARTQPVLLLRNCGEVSAIKCRINENEMIPEKDFLWQRTGPGEILLQILTTVVNPTNLHLSYEIRKSIASNEHTHAG